MKKILLLLTFLSVINAQADIEFSASGPAQATPQEISKSRSCFSELEVLGCGDPGDDVNQFKSCLKNVHQTLTSECKKMMTELYGI